MSTLKTRCFLQNKGNEVNAESYFKVLLFKGNLLNRMILALCHVNADYSKQTF